MLHASQITLYMLVLPLISFCSSACVYLKMVTCVFILYLLLKLYLKVLIYTVYIHA